MKWQLLAPTRGGWGDSVRVDGPQAVRYRVASDKVENEHVPTKAEENKPKPGAFTAGTAPPTAHPHKTPQTPRTELHRVPFVWGNQRRPSLMVFDASQVKDGGG